MQPAYYEDFTEIKKKIWSMLDNAIKDRGSPFRIPVFICGDQDDFDGRIVVLRKSDQENDITKESWLKTGHMSRKCYLVDNGPGTKSNNPTSGLKPELDNFEFTMEQSEVGYKNFTVIQCKIKSMEWLYLAAKGHRRARFDLENNKDNWLIP